MSYVLDALNKSQQQAQPLSAPTLSSNHLKPESNNGRLISLCVIVVLINIALVWYFFNNTTPILVTAAIPTLRPVEQLTVESMPVAQPKSIADNQSATSKITAATAIRTIKRPTALPELTITSHVYANTPIYRQVFINGQSLREQDWLQEDLQVKEITEFGVILLYQDVAFTIDLETHWQ